MIINLINKLSTLSLANAEALAGELPEVVITCGQKEGSCWSSDGSEIVWTSFGPYWVTVCKFSGFAWTTCYTGLPAY